MEEMGTGKLKILMLTMEEVGVGLEDGRNVGMKDQGNGFWMIIERKDGPCKMKEMCVEK